MCGMHMIKLGPAGVPLSCKGRTIRDGIEDIHGLGLQSMEIQLVRGKAVKELEDFEELGEIAKSLNIHMAIHGPYYMDLLGDKEEMERGLDMLDFAGEVGTKIGARKVVTHIGAYHGMTSREAIEKAIPILRGVRDSYFRKRYSTRLAIEVAGKKELFGSVREIVEICHRVKGVELVINWPHLHARGNRWLNDRESFRRVFKFVEGSLGKGTIYCHFSGVEFDNDGNERHYSPIKKGELKFEYLAEVILENDYDVNIISDSPLMEHDAMYMKLILERVESRRQERIARKVASERIKKSRRASEK